MEWDKLVDFFKGDSYLLKLVKVALSTLLALVIVLAIITIFHISSGKHITIFGIEYNKSDSIAIKQIVIHDTVFIKSTPLQIPTKQKNENSSTGSVTQNNSSGNNYNNSHHEENTTNNFKTPPRILDEKTFRNILSVLGTNKEEQVTIGYIVDDAEAKNYASQIIYNLQIQGYNITSIAHMGFNASDSNNKAGYAWVDKRELIILKQSNIE